MRAVPLFLLLFTISLSIAQAPESHRPRKPFLISVDQPAFIGEPIWVNERTRPTPYSQVGGECNRLELLYDGKPVPRRTVRPVFVGMPWDGAFSPISRMTSPDCIRAAIYNPSPGKRLPLHIWFDIQRPGRYALRWNYEWPQFEGNKPVTKRVSSAWITFNVQPSNPEDREKWLRHLFVDPNQSFVDLLGDYIPSLVAAAPDESALHGIAAQLYSNDQVAELAAEALAFFPEGHVRAAIFELIQKRGPTDFLAHLVSYNAFGLYADQDKRAQMTQTCFRYLRASDSWTAAAAIEMIRFNVHDDRQPLKDQKLIALADKEVLGAAPDIAAAGQENPDRELILYMRSIDRVEGHQLLIQMAHSSSTAADLANTALLLDHAPETNGPLLLEVKERSDVPHEFKTRKSYGVTITNLSGSAVSIEHGILIERKTPKEWVQNGGIQAVDSCAHYQQGYDFKAPVPIAPHSSLAVYPWDGFMCGGQCEDNCLQNVIAGPGIYRFVVTLRPSGTAIASLPFAFPGS